MVPTDDLSSIDLSDVPAWATEYDASGFPDQALAADVVAFALEPQTFELSVLSVRRHEEPYLALDAWPGGYVDAARDPDARAAALRALRTETGYAAPPYLETLDTYDALGRDPRQFAGRVHPETGRWEARGARVFSKAQLGLFRSVVLPAPLTAQDPEAPAAWGSVYRFLPWEDLRSEPGRRLVREIAERLRSWAAERPSLRERIGYAFAEQLEEWNEERVAERFQLMREAGLIEEAHRDRWGRLEPRSTAARRLYGQALAFDHRQMLADALARLRGKIKYLPVTLNALLPEEFTLLDLQRACEAIGGRKLYKTNFRQRIARTETYRIVEPVGRTSEPGVRRGPLAQLYRFPPDVLLLRLDPSIRLPWVPLSSLPTPSE